MKRTIPAACGPVHSSGWLSTTRRDPRVRTPEHPLHTGRRNVEYVYATQLFPGRCSCAKLGDVILAAAGTPRSAWRKRLAAGPKELLLCGGVQRLPTSSNEAKCAVLLGVDFVLESSNHGGYGQALWWITDDNLWRPTRRAEEHYTKDKLSTRRGAVHSIGWLYGSPDCRISHLTGHGSIHCPTSMKTT